MSPLGRYSIYCDHGINVGSECVRCWQRRALDAEADIQVLSIAFQRALNDLSRATGTTERSAILERMVVKRKLIVEGP